MSGMDEAGAYDHKHQNGADLEQNHDVVGPRRLADTSYQHNGQDQHDEKCGKIETQVPARRVDRVALKIAEAGGQKGGRNPTRTGMHAKPVHEIDDVGGEADAHRHIADGVLQDEIPTDDPGD